MKKILNLSILLFKEFRPRQWIKNLLVFTFIIYSGNLFNSRELLRVTELFFVFILLTSSVYIINDILDKEGDKKHKEKRKRPIASGMLPISIALSSAIVMLIAGAVWSYILGEYILLLYLFYLSLMICYSFYLKRLVIIDATVIALGFVLRAVAGAIIVDIPISSYVLIIVICSSLLLAFGKRRAEVTLFGTSEEGVSHRKVLLDYPVQLLDNLLSALFAATFLSYILLTFQQDFGNTSSLISYYLPSKLKNPHWLKFTIPLVFYGLARYMYLVYVRKEGGAFEELIIKDKLLLITVIIWILAGMIIIYSPYI